MIKKINYIIIYIFLSLPGCLKDNINEPVNAELDSSARLLHYLEEQGDYINSPEAPSLINADEVYSNLSNYLIIDVRTKEEFINGHIETAKNVSNTELLNYLLANDPVSYLKIVIVSANGQASAYYSCLLRLYGFNNVYSMNFGMAYWNIDFSDEWMQKIGNSENIPDYNNDNYPKGSFTKLPEVFEQSGKPVSELAKERIAFLIARGFVDKMDNINESNISQEMYFICYGSFDLYRDPVKDGFGHPPGAVLYQEYVDLKSVNYLQTIPNDKNILVYDYSGQLSAEVVAYLRLLGYNANSFLFGGCQLIYSRMVAYMNSFAFIPSRINSFPYITGE